MHLSSDPGDAGADPAQPSIMGPTSRGLHSAYERGSDHALGFIFEHWWPIAISWAQELMFDGDYAAAEDVVSEAMLILTKRFKDLERNFRNPEDNTKENRKRWTPTVVSFLCKTVNNLAKAKGRHRQVLQRAPRLESAKEDRLTVRMDRVRGVVPDSASLTAFLIDWRGARDRAGLSAEDWKIVLLHVFEGLTFREIAERVGRPLDTIYGRFRSALGRLRTVMPGAVFDDIADD